MEVLQTDDVCMWGATSVDEVFGLLFGEEAMGMNPQDDPTTMGMNPQGDPSGFTTELGGLFPLYQSWQQQDAPIGQPPELQETQQHQGGRLITTAAHYERTSTAISDVSSTESRTLARHGDLRSSSSASLASRSSTCAAGSEGSGALPLLTFVPVEGWQSLVHDLDEQAVPSQAKRGRKPVPGGTAKKPVKDKKRENTALIKQLEAEMASKLNIIKQLEGQNTELKRKERLLQLSVDTSENNMNRLVDPQLDTNLRDMLQTFRGVYNRPAADVALAKIAHIKDPKDMTFEIFSNCWQAITAATCDCLMADATASTPEAKQQAEANLRTLNEKTIDFTLALCLQNRHLIMEAHVTNLITGEPMPTEPAFWEGVVDKMNLTEEQIKDLAAAWAMHTRCKERNLAERALIKQELAAAVAAEEGMFDAHLTASSQVFTLQLAVREASERLSTNVMRGDTFDTFVSFLALRMMTPRQTAQMTMHASPTFPGVHRILMLAQQRALARGTGRRGA